MSLEGVAWAAAAGEAAGARSARSVLPPGALPAVGGRQGRTSAQLAQPTCMCRCASWIERWSFDRGAYHFHLDL